MIYLHGVVVEDAGVAGVVGGAGVRLVRQREAGGREDASWGRGGEEGSVNVTFIYSNDFLYLFETFPMFYQM